MTDNSRSRRTSPLATYDDYLKLRDQAEVVIDPKATFPAQVFRNPGRFFLTQYRSIVTPSAWGLIRGLAQVHGDAEVYWLVLEPQNEEYYLPKLGSPMAFAVAASADENDFAERLEYEPSTEWGDAIMFTSDRSAIFGPSGRWGIVANYRPDVAVVWVEEASPAVLACQRSLDPNWSTSQALQVASMDFVGGVPRSYSIPFLQNYPTGS